MYDNGVLATAPIQLCEVQAYAYRARVGIAELADELDDHVFAAALRGRAAELRGRFMNAFWDREERYVYLARDGFKKPCKVMSSNQGHCLWGQILDKEHARLIADHLMSARLFSGYGIRTLAADEKAYNPLSYHNGSIWPHDNSLIAEGFRFYDQLNHLQRLADALVDVTTLSEDMRLPELFCGFRRRLNEAPIPYEVACRPQAWAAGSLFLMLKSLLGLVMSPDQSDIIFQTPLLPSKVESIQLDDLRVRDTEFSVIVTRSKSAVHLEIPRKSGSMRILVQK
jgi:glycogen debranching enzyme